MDLLSGVFTGAQTLSPAAIAVISMLHPPTEKQGNDTRLTKSGRVVVGLTLFATVASIGSYFWTEHRHSQEEARSVAAKLASDERHAREQAALQTDLASIKAVCNTAVHILATIPNRDKVDDALKGTEVAVLVKEERAKTTCVGPNAFSRGEGQIRVFASSKKEDAIRQKAAFTTLLHEKGMDDWIRWVDMFSANLNSETMWVVVVNKVEPSRRDQLCDWMECLGWKPGRLKCDLR